jgi:ubiquinone/menaquinone biosynthesis C-methylase UbiE
VIAPKCRQLTATDFSAKMLKKAEKNCRAFRNITYFQADITALSFADGSFDKVVAGNVIHLLDNPLAALGELNRVCKDDGMLIIPTYMNKDDKGKTNGFSGAVGKAGADFKREFTVESYRQFFQDAGYPDVQIKLAEGRIPCAVAVMRKRQDESI